MGNSRSFEEKMWDVFLGGTCSHWWLQGSDFEEKKSGKSRKRTMEVGTETCIGKVQFTVKKKPFFLLTREFISHQNWYIR